MQANTCTDYIITREEGEEEEGCGWSLQSLTYCVPSHNDDIIIEGSIGMLGCIEVEEVTEVVIHVST